MISLDDKFSPSPLQAIEDERLEGRNIRLFLKRDDLLHLFFKEILFGEKNITPSVSGNKFRKMKYNLLWVKHQGVEKVLTFGGAFSNHIHAVAAAGQIFDFQTIGVIRGERAEQLSPTLRFAEANGMILHFINRSDYRNKELIVNELRDRFGDFYYLPEGGTNELALQGTAEIVGEIETQLNGKSPDFISVACGTGGTIAGIISAAKPPTHVLGFSALKGDFLQKDVTTLLQSAQNAQNTEGSYFFENNQNWSINTDFHCGGYARWTAELIDFINNFKEKHNIQLDPIYTGKMLLGIFKLAETGFFPQNSTIVAVHTGGLQGIEGFNQRFGQLISI
jgi:1-aminocyclopropane-1-carboxylate deaminase